jgi:hypothetical protein
MLNQSQFRYVTSIDFGAGDLDFYEGDAFVARSRLQRRAA